MTAVIGGSAKPTTPGDLGLSPIASWLRGWTTAGRWPSRWGWPAASALVCGLLAAALAAGAVPRWNAEAQIARNDTQRDADQLRVALRSAERNSKTSPPLGLPATTPPEERLADLLEAAVRAGVSIERVQQRADERGAVQALRVGLSARGSYAEIRAFMAQALQNDAALSLDRVQMRRAQATSDRIEADLQWSLLRQRPSSSGRGPAVESRPSAGVSGLVPEGTRRAAAATGQSPTQRAP